MDVQQYSTVALFHVVYIILRFLKSWNVINLSLGVTQTRLLETWHCIKATTGT